MIFHYYGILGNCMDGRRTKVVIFKIKQIAIKGDEYD